MKYLFRSAILTALSVLFFGTITAQTDEVNDATGLPIPIGAPVIYGQVLIENIPRDERRPNVFVSLLIGGTQVERRQTDNRGYFFFLERPRHGHALHVEINGAEVGRAYLIVGNSNRIRQDLVLDWRQLKGVHNVPAGVIRADAYVRTADADRVFDNAMSAIRENKPAKAIELFQEVVRKDAKDYVAWTMLGAIFHSEKRYQEASAALSKSLELRPQFTLARVNLGRVHMSTKDYTKAIDELTKAVESDRNSADANHLLGEALLQIKKGSLAVGFLNRAIEIAPIEKAELHLRLAALYNAANVKDRAAAEYKAFLKKVPNHPDKKKFEEYIKENSK